jgi:hypothetical protein
MFGMQLLGVFICRPHHLRNYFLKCYHVISINQSAGMWRPINFNFKNHCPEFRQITTSPHQWHVQDIKVANKKYNQTEQNELELWIKYAEKAWSDVTTVNLGYVIKKKSPMLCTYILCSFLKNPTCLQIFSVIRSKSSVDVGCGEAAKT